MRIFLFFIFITFFSGCATVEVAKEVTKASKSLKNTVDNMIDSFEKDKKVLEDEKKQEKNLITFQKKVGKINLLEKKLNDINLGKPNLFRKDGETQILRFDSEKCRLFLFIDIKDNYKRIKHFEIRSSEGKLFIKKNKIQNCYKELNLI